MRSLNRFRPTVSRRHPAAALGAAAPMTTDVHQHLWPPAFLAALRRRAAAAPGRLDAAPARRAAVRRSTRAHHDVEARAARADGRRRRARARGARRRRSGSTGWPPRSRPSSRTRGSTARSRCPPPFRAWAGGGIGRARRRRAARGAGPRRRRARGRGRRARRARGARPARAAARRARGAGRARCSSIPARPASADAAARPRWWAPVVTYVAAAARGLVGLGRRTAARAGRACACASPRSRGSRRCTASATAPRGGEPLPVDPLTFVETSSYGERAIDAVGRVLGIDVICHGSDRPYATSRLARPRRRRAARASASATPPACWRAPREDAA